MSWFSEATEYIPAFVGIIGFLLGLFLTFLCITGSFWARKRNWAKEREDIYCLHKKIAWINYEACNHNRYLRDKFFLSSNEKECALEYGKKEAKYLNCILSAFREDINKEYFGNDHDITLLNRHEVYLNMDKELYFLVRLFFFLDFYCKETKFSQYKMLEFDHKEGEYTSLYKLTDFGFFYYKLFYCVLRHCEEHPYIRSNPSYKRDYPYYGIHFARTLAGSSSDNIKKAIDSGMVTKLHYH